MRNSDPISAQRGALARARLVGGAAVLLAGVWAFWPMEVASIKTAALDAPAETKKQAGVNPDAFAVALWTAPPPPVEAAKPKAPPPRPPLKLQLVGITSEGGGGGGGGGGGVGVLRAALYDPETDKLFLVASGEKVGLFTVSSLTKDEVGLRDEQGERVLSLREDRRAP